MKKSLSKFEYWNFCNYSTWLHVEVTNHKEEKKVKTCRNPCYAKSSPSTLVLILLRCSICYHLYNLKNVKNTHGGVLILVTLQGGLQRY